MVTPDMIDKLTIGLQWNLPSPQTAFHCVHNMKRICREQSKPQTEKIKKGGMMGFVCV